MQGNFFSELGPISIDFDDFTSPLACGASVSVGFGSKELQREKWSAQTKHQKSRSSVFLCFQTPRKRLLRRLLLRLFLSFCFHWEDISNTRDSVSSAIQTPRISSNILRSASYCQLSSRCLDIPMNHCLSCLIYYFSLKLHVIYKLQVMKSSGHWHYCIVSYLFHVFSK